MKVVLTSLASLMLIATATAQVPAWSQDFHFGPLMPDEAVDIGVDANGNVYSAGTKGLNRDILVVSYAPNGTQRWATTYNGPGNKNDTPVEIAVDSNGDVFLVGMAWQDANTYGMITQKYHGGTGSLMWTRYHFYDDGMFGLMPCLAKGITLGPSGVLYACGAASVFNEFYDAYVVRQNRATGVIENTIVYGTTMVPAANQIAEDIAYNGTDGVFVGGSSADNQHPYSADGSDMFITRLSQTLTEVWTNTYDGYGRRDVARNIGVRGNDVFVFGNATTNPAVYPVLFLVKANATTGAEVWRKLRSTASDIDNGKMVLDPSGNPTIMGNIDMLGGLAMRYRASDGFLYWERILGEQYSDITTDAASATYLVGPTTMKLSHTGATLWNAPQAGASVATGPGNVLFTNRTQFNSTADLRTMRWFQAALTFTLSTNSTVGGVNVTGTLKSNLVAPPGGLTFNIAESSIYTATAPTATIPAGGTSANFTIFTAPNKGWTNILIPITATLNGLVLTQTLTLLPPVPQSLVMNPNSVTGGQSSTGTVTLTGKASASGLWVALSDNSAAVTTPFAVKVLANQTSAQFGVQTSAVQVVTVVTISAKSNGVTTTATLTVNP